MGAGKAEGALRRLEGMTRRQALSIYRQLLSRFGPQRWWPALARSEEARRFEVAVGAILTQNTAWTNAARAISALRQARCLKPRRLAALPTRRVASLIRSSGYFNQKSWRLKAFVRFLLKRHGGRMRGMASLPLRQAREELLSLSGIGPETADSILLYALDRPAFVVDVYTRRVLARHSFISWEAPYDQIQALFLRALPSRLALFNEYHALLVAVGKELCRPRKPLCHRCPLRWVGHLRLEPAAR